MKPMPTYIGDILVLPMDLCDYMKVPRLSIVRFSDTAGCKIVLEHLLKYMPIAENALVTPISRGIYLQQFKAKLMDAIEKATKTEHPSATVA